MENYNPTAAQTKQSAPTAQAQKPVQQKSDVSLQEFLQGQRQINGRLYDVDLKLLQAIVELRDALESVLKIDTTELNKAIELVKSSASVIPGVEPPGCEYPGGGGGNIGG